jgi:two-component system, OmpR family, response regulator
VAEPDSVSCHGLRVLVVDDNDDSRDLLGQALTEAGAMVWLASSARDALTMLNDVDVVVTDYVMPGETGVWLLERANARARPVPVIVLTAYADLHAVELASAPFARVLRKPVDPLGGLPGGARRRAPGAGGRGMKLLVVSCRTK